MKKKMNPFVKARYEHGYKALAAFAKVLEIPVSTVTNWETGRVSAVQSNAGWENFHKYYKALGWSKSRATENLENLYKWTKDPNVEVIKPNWEDYKNIVPYIGINPNAGDDVTANSDVSVDDTTNPLKAWRHKNHYSVEDAAKLMEISPILLSDIEDGVQKPNPFCVKKIIDIAGLSFHQVTKIFIDAQKAIEEEKNKEPKIVINPPEILEVPKAETATLPYTPAEHVTYETSHNDPVMITATDSQRLLDIVYGNITLDEYREIERMLGR